jgi:hypothetical protein
MVWYGISPLAEENPDALVEIAGASAWPDLLRWISRCLASRIETQPAQLDSLLSQIPDASEPLRVAILEGVDEGLQGWRKAPRPKVWDKVIEIASHGESEELVRDLSLLFGDGRALDQIKKVALDGKADFAMRKAALETLIENKPDDLREICESLLGDRLINAVAVKGLVLFDDP